MRTKLQRIQVTRRNTNMALSVNQSAPHHGEAAAHGPPHAPRNSSAPRYEVPIMWAYSPSWISANFMPEYSTRNPATSSDSASGMSNRTRLSGDRVGRRDAGDPEPSREDHRHRRHEDEGQVVGDDLVDRPHRGEQRVLVVGAPAAHEENDDLHRRHREEDEDPDVEVGDPEAGRERQRGEDQHAGDEEHDRRQVVDRAVS